MAMTSAPPPMKVGQNNYGCEWAAVWSDGLDSAVSKAVAEMCARTQAGQFFLDIGGGTGARAEEIAALGVDEVHVLDLGARHDDIAARNAALGRTAITFSRADIREGLKDILEQRPWSFIHSRRVLHFLEKEQVARFFDDIWRHATPGALVIVSFECRKPRARRDPALVQEERRDGGLDSRGQAWVPRVLHDGEELAEQLAARGFEMLPGYPDFTKHRCNFTCEMMLRVPPQPLAARPQGR